MSEVESQSQNKRSCWRNLYKANGLIIVFFQFIVIFSLLFLHVFENACLNPDTSTANVNLVAFKPQDVVKKEPCECPTQSCPSILCQECNCPRIECSTKQYERPFCPPSEKEIVKLKVKEDNFGKRLFQGCSTNISKRSN